MASILVTGGAGFIGSHLVDALIEKGHKVVVVDNLSMGNEENINKKALFVKADICDDLTDLFSHHRFDFVFHLAAQINLRKSLTNPKDDASTNIIGSLNIIDHCLAHNSKIIFSSSGGALYASDAQQPCTEHSPIDPSSPYGVAKHTVERYLKIMHQTRALNYCALRYSNVYGPRQNSKGEAGVIALFIDSLLDKKQPCIFGDGAQTRDFVFVKDVVAANILAMSLDGSYNVGTGVETSVNGLAEDLRSLLNSPLAFTHGPSVKGELARNALDCSKLRKQGWSPKFDLKQGLNETIRWFTSRP